MFEATHWIDRTIDTRSSEDNSKLLCCSFCGKSQREVHGLTAGPSVFICDECADLHNDIVRGEMQEAQAEGSGHKLPASKEIHIILSRYVVGQERAKKVLTVAVYNHYKRLSRHGKKDDIELGKSNILMIGLTGSGKTLPTEALARLLNMPFTIANATTLTGAGHVGEDIENIIQGLLQKYDYDVEKAQMGTVYIGEIDKISRKSDNPSITHDAFGEGIQQALLRLIEGTVTSVLPQGGCKHPQQESLRVDTCNILFICGSAFASLERVIQNRFIHGGIDFNAEVRSQEMGKKVDEALREVELEDLAKFDLIPEFVGRLSVIAILDELDEATLTQILTGPKNALTKQYAKPSEMEGVDLELRPDALKVITYKAFERKTGTRGPHSILEGILLNTMHEIPSQQDVSKMTINKSITDGSSQPLMIYENSEKPAKAAPEVWKSRGLWAPFLFRLARLFSPGPNSILG